MEKSIKQISKEIRSGELLEENIPLLFNQLASHYNTYAEVRLALHYFGFYESFCDDENTWSKDSLEIVNKLNVCIRDHILKSQSGSDREIAIQAIDNIRKDIMKRMDALMAYTDVFQIYEHVLNRIEYRFKDKLETVDEEEFAKTILRYIFDTEDSLIINEKIKDIIGQLPIRITKQKFFELIQGSMRSYLGADTASLDSYLYMIKTSAMLYHQEGMELLYPELQKKKDALDQIAYKDINKENYEKALYSLKSTTIFLEIETTIIYGLQEIVNEIYTILLCSSYAGTISSEADAAETAALQILNEINNDFVNLNKAELTDDILEKFTDMEGIQEEMSYEISTMEDALYEIKTSYKSITESLMLDKLMRVLLRSQNLLSNSIFIPLEEDMNIRAVEEDSLEKETQALIEEFMKLFNHHDRMISRAVMANILSKMPVFFDNHKEVMDYVLYSLLRCSDEYEKAASVDIIRDMMKED